MTVMKQILKGQFVTLIKNGKRYQAWRDSFIDSCARNDAVRFPAGQHVVYLQPINPKTGKGWQAASVYPVSEVA
jgi:hypothetical protein